MSIGVWQVVLVLVIVLIIFGAGKLPRVMGDVAKGIKNFKSGMKEGEDVSGDDEQKVLRSEAAAPAEAAPQPAKAATQKDKAAEG